VSPIQISSTVSIVVVSSDFAFWKAGQGDPGEIFDCLADGVTEALEPHSDVSWFRGELLSRWPDLVDVIEPMEDDLFEAPEDGAKYVLLTLPVGMLDCLDGIFDLARQHGLSGYSGVAGQSF
jgi:hypothetical protein